MHSPCALIIDDNDFNTEVMSRLLANLGGSSMIVRDPTRLLDVLDDLHCVDVVFLDLEMPKIDGYEVLHRLKDDLGLTVPVVAYTVHTSEVHVVRGEGFDGFLGKPIDPALFPRQLERILNGEAVWYIP